MKINTFALKMLLLDAQAYNLSLLVAPAIALAYRFEHGSFAGLETWFARITLHSDFDVVSDPARENVRKLLRDYDTHGVTITRRLKTLSQPMVKELLTAR